MKRNNTHVTAVPVEEEKEHRTEKLLEKIMTKNFPNLALARWVS